MKPLAIILVALLLSSFAIADDPDAAVSPNRRSKQTDGEGKVKVFVLAGQDNMQGSGNPAALAWQVSQPEYRNRWTRFIKDADYDAFLAKVAETKTPGNSVRQPTYLWSERDDVWINYFKRCGNLTVGFAGVPNGFGPEFNFGQIIGDHFEEQVLIIKVAWRGRALGKEFMPPSSLPSEEEFAQLVEAKNVVIRKANEEGPARAEAFNKKTIEQNKARSKDRQRGLWEFEPEPLIKVEDFKKPYGKDYLAMVREVRDCLSNLEERFPGYQDQGYELSGFVWFQGWNDVGKDLAKSYEQNLTNLVRDLRKEFDVPELPIVIGQMGQRGQVSSSRNKPAKGQLAIMNAQAAVANLPEFKGNTRCVKTQGFLDADAHRVYFSNGGWRKNKTEWEHFGKDMPGRYYGSPWTFSQIGTAFGEGMIQLLEDRK